jgi:hypothetical protein
MRSLHTLVLLAIFAAAQAIPSVISGPWYYIADGNEDSHAYSTIPSWMNNAGNWISLAFMNPKDLSGTSDPVPAVYKTTTTYFKNLGKTVFFSIGGYGFAGDWTWLSDSTAAYNAGAVAASIAKNYSVGIEIDYEGGADPTSGLASFVQGFRAYAPMGTYLLTMDLYGSPGGAPWQSNTVPKLLPPTGKPGQVYGSGNYLDYVNVMVIDGQTVETDEQFWNQWLALSYFNAQRSTFGLIAGWPGLGICEGDSTSDSYIDQAVSFLQPKGVYGITSWAVCPPAPGQTTTCGDWDPNCNANAPGFAYLCQKLGSC